MLSLFLFVQSALAFQTEETGLFFRHARFPLCGGLHITDRQVTLFPQWVIRQIMFLEVIEHIFVGPVDHRQELEDAALHRQHRQIATSRRLLTT